MDCTEFDQTYVDWIRESNLEGEEELQYLTSFVEVNSSVYPQLEDFYEDRARAWEARKQEEFAQEEFAADCGAAPGAST